MVIKEVQNSFVLIANQLPQHEDMSTKMERCFTLLKAVVVLFLVAHIFKGMSLPVLFVQSENTPVSLEIFHPAMFVKVLINPTQFLSLRIDRKKLYPGRYSTVFLLNCSLQSYRASNTGFFKKKAERQFKVRRAWETGTITFPL